MKTSHMRNLLLVLPVAALIAVWSLKNRTTYPGSASERSRPEASMTIEDALMARSKSFPSHLFGWEEVVGLSCHFAVHRIEDLSADEFAKVVASETDYTVIHDSRSTLVVPKVSPKHDQPLAIRKVKFDGCNNTFLSDALKQIHGVQATATVLVARYGGIDAIADDPLITLSPYEGDCAGLLNQIAIELGVKMWAVRHMVLDVDGPQTLGAGSLGFYH